MTLRLLLCDDQTLTRTGFRKLLEAYDGLEVVGEVDRPSVLLPAARRLRPDVVITECRLSGVLVPDLVAQVLEDSTFQAKVLMLSSEHDEDMVAASLRAGATGYALKTQSLDELVVGIRAVGAGEGLLAPAVTRPFLQHFATYRRSADSDLRCEVLTGRELDVLRLLAEGLSNLEIARLLQLGEATVKSHVSHILTKLDLRDRVQAAVFAYRSGLVPIPPTAVP
jgi:DNA-binding NarL/FixJ family response regulator